MKNIKRFAFMVGVMLGAGVWSVSAYAMPDRLLSEAPEKVAVATTENKLILVPVANDAVKEALHAYVEAWGRALAEAEAVKQKKESGAALTNLDKHWLRSLRRHFFARDFRVDSTCKVHFYKSSLNWNGENLKEKEYNYETLAAYNERDGYTNSYGFAELISMVDEINAFIKEESMAGGPSTEERAAAIEQGILAIMDKAQVRVSNEELRSYMNETVWYAAKQTVKDMERKAMWASVKDEEN